MRAGFQPARSRQRSTPRSPPPVRHGKPELSAVAREAFGYELCKCEFPPTPMKTVGYTRDRQVVYQCPKCGFNTAMGRTITRKGEPEPLFLPPWFAFYFHH